MWAIVVQASADAMDFSQSFANRRHLPSHAKVRSTTQRRGRTSKPFALSVRLTIWRVNAAIFLLLAIVVDADEFEHNSHEWSKVTLLGRGDQGGAISTGGWGRVYSMGMVAVRNWFTDCV